MMACLSRVIATVGASFELVVQKFRNQYIRVIDRYTCQHLHGTGGQEISGVSTESDRDDSINTMFNEPFRKKAGSMLGSFFDTLADYGALLHVGIHEQELLGVPEMLCDLTTR